MKTSENFKQLKLENGLTVLLYKMADVRSACATLYVRTGAVFEPEDQRGISHLTEHSAFIGTQKYPTGEIISKTADNLGIFYSGSTSKDSTFYTIKAPYMNIKKGLELLHEFVFSPVLNDEQVSREKEVILSEYGDFWNDPVRRFDHEMWRKRFNQDEHPYSRRPMGKPETIEKLTLKMILDWRKKYYCAANMILSVAGNFQLEEIERNVESLFGTDPSGEAQFEPKYNTNDYSKFTVYYQKDERKQITFYLTFPTFGWREISRPKRIELRLFNQILGAARTSRLYERLREKEKLTYKMFSDRRLMAWMGAIVIGASVPVAKLVYALSAVRNEIDKLLTNGVTDEELELAKNFSESQNFLQFDNPSEISKYFADEAYYEEEILFPEDRNKIIRAVNKAELNNLAKKIFDYSRVNIGILGNVPPEALAEIERIFKS